jgi:glycosyltransferase involved in cell wall biosynthesis
MIASVVIATFNKAPFLRRTLNSIISQRVPFDYEIIVVDDGSTDDTKEVCNEFPVRYVYLDRPGYLNPGPARNVGYRLAEGDIIINQSDEVEHKTKNTIELLVKSLGPENCIIAKVNMVTENGEVLWVMTGAQFRRRLFFLGSVWRKDLYSVGGNDEDFTKPGYDDRWLADCLTRLPRTFVFRNDILGWHYSHEEPISGPRDISSSKSIYRSKLWKARRGKHPWTARTGAWT